MRLLSVSSVLLTALALASGAARADVPGAQGLRCAAGDSGISIVPTTDLPGAQDRVVFTSGLLASVNYYLFPAPGGLPNLYYQDYVTGQWRVAGTLRIIETMTSPPSYEVTYTTTTGVTTGYACGRGV